MGEEGRHDLEKARVKYAIEAPRSRTRDLRERTLPTDHSHAARHRDAGATREYQRDSSYLDSSRKPGVTNGLSGLLLPHTRTNKMAVGLTALVSSAL
jgi:hypothetical protein